jgi:DNA anti-recombination protein RmuC
LKTKQNKEATTMEQQTATAQAQEAKRFSDTCEQFGEQMAAWGEEFGRQMEAWGSEFGQRMEAWSKEFGPRMEVWAEELAQKLELAGERVREWLEEQRASSAASASNLREERLAILRMVAEGKISVTEAESLLRALGE